MRLGFSDTDVEVTVRTVCTAGSPWEAGTFVQPEAVANEAIW